jgi:hypothetical protein
MVDTIILFSRRGICSYLTRQEQACDTTEVHMASHVPSHVVPTRVLEVEPCHPHFHFLYENSEAVSTEVTCPESHSKEVEEQGLAALQTQDSSLGFLV